MDQNINYGRLIPLENLHLAANTEVVHSSHRHENNQTTQLDNPFDSAAYRFSIDSSGSVRQHKNTEREQKGRGERKSIPLRENRAAAVWYFLQFHAIPIAVALAFTIINIQSRYVGPDGSWANLLQFPAKVHELLMQVSISTSMVAYLQYLLTQRRSGVPFGSIFSAYNVTRLGYLLSPEFRASVTARHFDTLLKIGFVLFVPFSILLAAAVGPASAIAMTPRLVNFTVPDSLFAVDHSYEEVYPVELAKPGKELNKFSMFNNEQSPAIGWEYTTSLPVVGDDYATETDLQYNWDDKITFPSLYSTEIFNQLNNGVLPFRRTLYVQFAPNGSIATAQHVPTAAALSKTQSIGGGTYTGAPKGLSTVKMPQPFTSTTCILNSIMGENDTRPLKFPNAYLSPDASLVGNITYGTITRKELWNQHLNGSEGRIIWVDDIPQTKDGALGAIIVQPYLCNNGKEYLATSACIVGGTWANATSRMIVTQDVQEYGELIENMLPRSFLNDIRPWQQKPVSFKKPWADSITSLIVTQNRTVADNSLRSLLVTDNICPPNGSYPSRQFRSSPAVPRPLMHESLLSALLANGMSHATGEFHLRIFNDETGKFENHYSDEEDTGPPGLVITIQSNAEGYGWNMDGTAIRLAVPILILYCLYASTYVAYTFITGRSSHAWQSLADLTALAFNSTPSKVLENTSAGISEGDTFKELVSVQEVEKHGQLELVFKQDEGSLGPIRRVKPGRAY
ncbi:hypothetical protein FQN55_003639 [Onygenales sp. PD_40]|nr:hypothetical protein FQN55_003639 [Onygenales sp. PD_40]KAK2789760.1 hypothetical protein FQN52_005885 [Onygenales sp. PD_12]KAK2802750.1 hypothetical protein FQN51_004278 [Onygenales sp. PD_10]